MNKGAEKAFSKLENRLLCFFVRINLIQSPMANSKMCYLQIIFFISMDFSKKCCMLPSKYPKLNNLDTDNVSDVF